VVREVKEALEGGSGWKLEGRPGGGSREQGTADQQKRVVSSGINRRLQDDWNSLPSYENEGVIVDLDGTDVTGVLELAFARGT
jgi:hypothetical protein